jgi:hypothetical protein
MYLQNEKSASTEACVTKVELYGGVEASSEFQAGTHRHLPRSRRKEKWREGVAVWAEKPKLTSDLGRPHLDYSTFSKLLGPTDYCCFVKDSGGGDI